MWQVLCSLDTYTRHSLELFSNIPVFSSFGDNNLILGGGEGGVVNVLLHLEARDERGRIRDGGCWGQWQGHREWLGHLSSPLTWKIKGGKYKEWALCSTCQPLGAAYCPHGRCDDGLPSLLIHCIDCLTEANDRVCDKIMSGRVLLWSARFAF